MTSRRWIRLAAGAALAGGLAACHRGGRATEGVSDSTFVATIVQLRRIGTDSSLDSTARDSARRMVLRQRGLTAARLEDVARSMASDPDHAIAVWRAIDEQLDPRHGIPVRHLPASAGGTPSAPSPAPPARKPATPARK